jgi:hypothetical protein
MSGLTQALVELHKHSVAKRLRIRMGIDREHVHGTSLATKKPCDGHVATCRLSRAESPDNSPDYSQIWLKSVEYAKSNKRQLGTQRKKSFKDSVLK